MEDKEIIKKIKGCKSTEELKSLGKEIGYELSDKEAAYFLDKFTMSGELSDDELADVNGGACCKWRNGRCYSSVPEYRLIVTAGNSCKSYDLNPGYPEFKKKMFAGTCTVCLNMDRVGLTMYCNIRKYYDDPYNR